jgi:hypothetical protein
MKKDLETLEKQMTDLREEITHEPEYVLSDFDARILAFEEELNASETPAEQLHPDVHNLPHTLKHTPPFNPEYAD